MLRRVLHQHLTLPDFLALPEALLGYRIAVFVRNPYDRVVSGFVQIQRDCLRQTDRPFDPPWLKALITEQLRECQDHVERSGPNVSKWIESVPEHLVREIGRNTNLYLHPCTYWTHLDGKRVADFIGKVECFEADFARLCREFDLTSVTMASANVSLGLEARIGVDGYRYPHYLSSSAKRHIESLFCEDFKLLAYSMLA